MVSPLDADWNNTLLSDENLNKTTLGSGSAFPSTWRTDRLFFRTDTKKLYKNSGTQGTPVWTEVGATGVTSNEVTWEITTDDTKYGTATTPTGSSEFAETEYGAYHIENGGYPSGMTTYQTLLTGSGSGVSITNPDDALDTGSGSQDTGAGGNSTSVYDGLYTGYMWYQMDFQTSDTLLNRPIYVRWGTTRYSQNFNAGSTGSHLWVSNDSSVDTQDLDDNTNWTQVGADSWTSSGSSTKRTYQYSSPTHDNVTYRYVKVRVHTSNFWRPYLYAVGERSNIGTGVTTTHSATSANDSDDATRFESTSEANPFLIYDMGANTNFAGIKLKPHANTTCDELKIQTSYNNLSNGLDPTDWKTVRTLNYDTQLTAGSDNYISFNVEEGRYVRIFDNTDANITTNPTTYETDFTTSTNWTFNQGGGTVQLSNGELSIYANNDFDNPNATYDLQTDLGAGNFASTTSWLLRFKLRFVNMQNYHSSQKLQFDIGLADTSTIPSALDDYANIDSVHYSMYVDGQTNTYSERGKSWNTATTSTELSNGAEPFSADKWIEIIRDGNDIVFKTYSDKYYVLDDTVTINPPTSNMASLRYIFARIYNGQLAQSNTVYVDDIEFYDGYTSATNAPTNPQKLAITEMKVQNGTDTQIRNQHGHLGISTTDTTIALQP